MAAKKSKKAGTARKAKKATPKKVKKDLTTTVTLAINGLRKEASKKHELLDKLKPTHKGEKKNLVINSPFIVRRNCDRLVNHLRQRMFHPLALKVTHVSKLVENNMSQRAIKSVVDVMNDISYDHGFDFGGN